MRTHEIRLAGRLDPEWTSWFEDFSVVDGADGCTILSGPILDQAALHGLLRRIADLGLPLVAVNVIDQGPTVDQSAIPTD